MPRTGDAKPMTVEEYLKFEEEANLRHEFVDGFVFAMAGGTEEHNRIAGAIYARSRLAEAKTACRAYMEGVKLRVPNGSYYYPDVFLSCDESEFGESIKTNACFIVEVLSKSTADIDRGEKLNSYLKLSGLKAYVLVSQDKRFIEVYRLLQDGSWRYEAFESGSFELPCLNLTMTFDDVYEGVDVN